MKTRVHVVLLLVVTGVGAAARAEAAPGDASPNPGTEAAETPRGDAYVSLITRPTGEPILKIEYPWNRHARPSLEVRVLAPDEVDAPLIRPLFFVATIMEGEVTRTVYQCQGDSERTAQVATFRRDGMDFEVFGARNALGRPSVCAACRTAPGRRQTLAEVIEEAEQSEPEIESLVEAPKPETRAVFPLLDAWAVDRRTLYLELPAKYFSQPSKIRVWLLRRDDVLWRADVDWPGTGEAAAAPE